MWLSSGRLLWVVALALPAINILMGLPLAFNMVPPNRFFGFRASPAFDSLQAWYQVNSKLGYCLLVAGVLALILTRTFWGRLSTSPESARIIFVVMGNTILTSAAIALCVGLVVRGTAGR